MSQQQRANTPDDDWSIPAYHPNSPLPPLTRTLSFNVDKLKELKLRRQLTVKQRLTSHNSSPDTSPKVSLIASTNAQPRMSQAKANEALQKVVSMLDTWQTKRTDTPWTETVEAFQSCSMLLENYPHMMQSHLDRLVECAADNLQSPRSGVCKAALVVLKDMSNVYGAEMKHEELLLPHILKRAAAKEAAFIAEAAHEALDSLIKHGNIQKLLVCLTAQVSSSTPPVRIELAWCMDEIFQHCSPAVSMVLQHSLATKCLQAAAALCSDGSSETRTRAKKIIKAMKQLVEGSKGVEGFQKLINLLDEPTATTVKSVCAV